MSRMKKKVCILGWYGTETLGDRAILDGILSIFYHTYGNCDFFVGSLYPFFTERTVYEDGAIYSKSAPDCKISIFDVKGNITEYIQQSDIVIMGGGPIMELDLLYLIYRGFKIAKRCNKQTVVLGCGLGPLKTKRLIGMAKKIITIADLVIFRDEESLKYANILTGGKYQFYALEDPAIISILQYRGLHKESEKETYLAINVREPDHHYPKMGENIENDFVHLIAKACEQYEKVKLVPMHTFYVGKDDRKYMSRLALVTNSNKLEVLHKPLNLYELYEVYEKAQACIGMRYHSVVMQTLLNGNNYILDYTEKNKGKISGFISMLKNPDFYTDRYVNIVSDAIDAEACLKVISKKKYYECAETENAIEQYCELLSLL